MEVPIRLRPRHPEIHSTSRGGRTPWQASEAGAFVGAARKASLKQPLKFDNVQGFILDCMKQTARGEPSTPSSSRADKEEDVPEKPGSAEEELARLKVETMRYMVENYSLGESLHTSRVIYFTNDQALKVSPVQMPMVREALGIHEPKLVIRLVPCQKGRTYWEGRPAIRNILPTKANPELEGHEQMVETDMNLIAREALIIGTSSCSLTTAFAEVSAPIQRRYGELCPFRMVIFEQAWNMHVRSTMKSDSVEHILKEKLAPWSKANFVKALSHKFGCDPAFWPQQKLVKGAAAYMVFECLRPGLLRNEERLHDSRAAVQFENMFVTSLHTYLPVLAFRHHDLIEQDWDPDNPGLEGKFDFADMSMQEAVRKLTNLGKALNKTHGCKIDRDRDQWLYDAIVEAMLEAAHGDPPPGLDGTNDLRSEDLEEGGEELNLFAFWDCCLWISKATEFFLAYVGQQTSKEAEVNTSLMEEAIQHLEACMTWQELEEAWKPASKKLHNAIAHNGWDKVTMEGVSSVEGLPVILARPRNEFLPTGLPDEKKWGAARLMGDKKKWLAVYDILKTSHVYSCSLSDYRGLKHLIQKLSRSERLPDSSSLEALLLLRCAWTLADIFDEKADRFKLWAKLAYATLLIMGVIVVFFTTAEWTADLSTDTKKFVLGLGLGSSSLAAWVTFTDPGKKWLKLRAGSEMLQAEIWRFRTRVGSYANNDLTHFNVGRAEAERLRKIFLVADTVLGAKVLVSANTTTDDVCIRFEGTRQHLETMIHERLRLHRLTSAHFRHKQYQKGQKSEAPPTGKDLDRIPVYMWRRLIIQALFMIATVLTAVLSAADQTNWTAIVVSISSALGSWQDLG
eukprot:s5694_g2.t1